MAITSYKAVVGYYNSAGTPNITTAVTGQLSDGWIPIGAPILTDAYGQCTQMMAKTDATPVIATSAYTVVTAANPQPPDATWDAQGEPLWIDTATYLQAYTKGGAYLQGTVPVSRGGTGATTTLAAAANLRVFAIPNNLSEITDRSAAWLNVRPTGPLPLGGDPVNDYDATTMRWVKNYVDTGGGSGGASMNGVMNYGVGDFHLRDSRAFIQPYEVFSDGQLLNRADWPELWAYAQMLSPISDADWLADTQKRGKYSLGDGTTTFRVPDRNGVQAGSIGELFARGDGGISSNNGIIYEAAAPNIAGGISDFFGFSAAAYTESSGALRMAGKSDSTPLNQWNTNHPGVEASYNLIFNASLSDTSYGKYGITGNIIPRNFVGVWVIRANGGFTAANTQWQVINADATTPPVNTVVYGGAVRSEYKIGAAVTYQASLQAYGTVGGTTSQQGLRLGTNSKSYDFTDSGTLMLPDSSVQIGTRRPLGDLIVDAYLRPKDCYVKPTESLGVSAVENNTISIRNFQSSINSYVSWLRGDWYSGSYVLGGIRGSSTLLEKFTIAVDSGGAGAASFDFYPNGVAHCTNWLSTSDERLKTNIRRIEQPLDKMRKIKGVTWERMDVNPTPAGIGFIAQDVETAFPDYVNVLGSRTVTLKDGTVVGNIKSLDIGGVAAALHHEAILALMDKVEALEAELSALKSGK